jgi:hypothetical protein
MSDSYDQSEKLPEPQFPPEQNGPIIQHFAVYPMGHVRIVADVLTQPNGDNAIAYAILFQKRPHTVGNYVTLEDLVHLRTILDRAIEEGVDIVTQRAEVPKSG